MDVKEHILESSMALFTSMGCKATTMDEIAAQAGISKRTLYEQFTDKENLLEECIHFYDQKQMEHYRALEQDSENILDLVLRAHYVRSEQLVSMAINFYSEVKRYYPQVFKNTIAPMQEVNKKHTRLFLERGQKEKMFRENINLDLVSEFFDTMCYVVHKNDIALAQRFSYEALFRDTVICYIRGMSTEEGVKYIDNYDTRKIEKK